MSIKKMSERKRCKDDYRPVKISKRGRIFPTLDGVNIYAWQAIIGCIPIKTKYANSCDFCKKEKKFVHLSKMRVKGYYKQKFGNVRLIEERLNEPFFQSGCLPRCYIIASFSDIFNEDVNEEWLDAIFEVVAACPKDIFYVTTKRSKRLVEYVEKNGALRNVIYGVTVESNHWLKRAAELSKLKQRLNGDITTLCHIYTLQESLKESKLETLSNFDAVVITSPNRHEILEATTFERCFKLGFPLHYNPIFLKRKPAFKLDIKDRADGEKIEFIRRFYSPYKFERLSFSPPLCTPELPKKPFIKL